MRKQSMIGFTIIQIACVAGMIAVCAVGFKMFI